MPKADALSTTPRRAMMAAPAEACPDAALLEVCRRYDALTDKIKPY